MIPYSCLEALGRTGERPSGCSNAGAPIRHRSANRPDTTGEWSVGNLRTALRHECNKHGVRMTGLTWNWLLYDDQQLDAARKLHPPRSIYSREGRTVSGPPMSPHPWQNTPFPGRGAGIHHFGVALAIESPLNQYNQLFWIHCSLSSSKNKFAKFDGAHLCIECVKSHTVNGA